MTVMSLTDHDGVAGVPEANRAAAELGIENVPAVEMSCVHKYSEDLHICGYWVDLEKIAARPATAPSRSASTAPRRSSPSLNEHGVDVTFEDAVAKAGAADCDRPPAHRQGRRRRPRPRPVLRGVPGPGRQGVRRRAAGRAPSRPSS